MNPACYRRCDSHPRRLHGHVEYRIRPWFLGVVLWAVEAAAAALGNPLTDSDVVEYTFLTLAGSATTSAAVDGAGREARFSLPFGIAVDRSGTVYVADTDNGTIRSITPEGQVATVAGVAGTWGRSDGLTFEARFAGPRGIAVGLNGEIYVADTWNHTIRRINPNGIVITWAGAAGAVGSTDGPGGEARFSMPWGLAVGPHGDVFVADTANHTIRKITPDGHVSTVAGLAPPPGVPSQDWAEVNDGVGASARFAFPCGIAADAAGNLYVADGALSIHGFKYSRHIPSHTIRMVDPHGRVATLAGTLGVSGAIDGPGLMARFNQPAGIALSPSGDLYVADSNNQSIRRVRPDGTVSTFAGMPGEPGTADGVGAEARFGWDGGNGSGNAFGPSGVAVDAAGNVYVADTVNHTIRRITPDAQVTTFAGQTGGRSIRDGPAAEARFVFPTAVVVDESGTGWVADAKYCIMSAGDPMLLCESGSVIRKVDPTGVISTWAGTPGSGDSQDGAGSEAHFQGPCGLVPDGAGGLYVADTGGHTLRHMDAQGVVTTIAGSSTDWRTDIDGPAALARFSAPATLALDPSGTLWVLEGDARVLRKLDADGLVTTVLVRPYTGGCIQTFCDPGYGPILGGLAVGDAGTLYIADPLNAVVLLMAPDGTTTTLAGIEGQCGVANGPVGTARFMGPSGLANDGQGGVVVADAVSHTIRRISPDRHVTTLGGLPGLCGSVDGTGNEACFRGPKGIALDAFGRLWVADSLNASIRIGYPALRDRPVVDLPVAPLGVRRHLDTSPQTASAWRWSWVRKPGLSRAELSSTTIRNPTFDPDVPDLYILQLLATNNATGAVSLRRIELRAVPGTHPVLVPESGSPHVPFRMTMVGPPNASYRIQVSGDLVTWTDWLRLRPATPASTVIDTSAGNHTHRFYRALRD